MSVGVSVVVADAFEVVVVAVESVAVAFDVGVVVESVSVVVVVDVVAESVVVAFEVVVVESFVVAFEVVAVDSVDAYGLICGFLIDVVVVGCLSSGCLHMVWMREGFVSAGC